MAVIILFCLLYCMTGMSVVFTFYLFHSLNSHVKDFCWDDFTGDDMVERFIRIFGTSPWFWSI